MRTYIIIAVIMVALIGYGVYQYDKISKLETELKITEQNLLASQDTLKRYATENGELVKKMAFIEKDFSRENDSLSNILKEKNIKIITQQKIIVKLDSIINAGYGIVIVDTNNIKYYRKDTSKFYNFDLAVSINPKTKIGSDSIKIWSDPIKIRPVIYQDEYGKIYGSVESLTPEVTIESIESKITSDFIIQREKPIYSSLWERLGFYGSTNINGFDSFEGGLVIRPFYVGYQKFIDKKELIKIGINITFTELFKGIL